MLLIPGRLINVYSSFPNFFSKLKNFNIQVFVLTSQSAMAPLQHRVRKVQIAARPVGAKLKRSKNGNAPVITEDMSVQALRDLKTTQTEKNIVFEDNAVNQFAEMYGVLPSRETVLSILRDASVKNADDILMLYERIVDLENKLKKQENHFRLPTIVQAPILPDEYVQMSTVAEVLDGKR